ncbi:MAG: DUF3995 domain-containing protein [Arachnia sp.]
MLLRPEVPEDGEMHPRSSSQRRTPGHAAFVAAGMFGVIHAGFSLFWAVGGTWLLWSLGSGLLQTFEGREWILFPVGVVKLVAAVTPLALFLRGWPAHRLTRAACWVGASVLILWGGLNTVVGNLVLSGLIQPSAGYDRPGMIGHAWMWDPLFLGWGVALVIGLLASGRRDRAVPQPGQLQSVRDL